MKKNLRIQVVALAFVLAVATLVWAQESYNIAVTAATVSNLDWGRTQFDTASCGKFGLLSTCTQGQACAASLSQAGQPTSGASCNSSEALAVGARVYPNSLTGRQNYVEEQIIKAAADALKRQRAKTDFATMQAYCKSATQIQIDLLCTDTGQPAGCGVCDSFR